MILHFNKQFKDGALKAIELFKVVFDVNKNVIISQNNDLHINNTELLIQERNFSNKDFQFGFNFVIENVDKIRERLCINPIFYLLFLERVLIFNYETALNDLKLSINDIREIFNTYCASSKITSARPNFEELNIIAQEFLKDDFLKEVLKQSYGSKFVMIQESAENVIKENPYYFLHCTKYGKNNVYNDMESIIWFSTITEEELQNFIDFCTLNNKRVAVFFNSIVPKALEKLKENSFYFNDLIFLHYPGLNFYDVMKDINLLSGKKYIDTFYDVSFGPIYNYNFGKLKTIIFEERTAKIIGSKQYEDYKQDLTYLNTEKNLERLSMLRGDSIVVNCKEELIDSSRIIVSLARSIYTKGLFYDEITALQLFLFYFTNLGLTNNRKKITINLLHDVLKEFLKLYGCSNQQIFQNAYDGKMDVVFNPIIKEFQKEKRYTSKEIYDITFDFLLSNIKLFNSIRGNE